MKRISITALLLVITMLIPIFDFNMAYAAEIEDWKIEWMGGCKGSAELDAKEKYSGTSSLKIVNESPDTGNVYYLMTQNVSVEAGKSYYVGAKLKLQGASVVDFCVSWKQRYRATNFGSTFDWNNFEFLYQATETKTETFQFLVTGVCDAVWIDDSKFEDIETGENLLKNHGFDSGMVSSSSNLSNSYTNDELYKNITTGSTFKTDDMAKVLGAIKYIPVYRAENLSIDGNTDDWANYPAIEMPAISEQYLVYIDDGNELDNNITYKFAYDTQMFYMLAEVTDNVHIYNEGQNHYWQGDSLQLAFGGMESSFGTEVGIAFGEDDTECDVYGITRTRTTAIETYGKREGNKSIYEFCLPWDSFFSEIPDRLRFDAALNDNDGEGRRYCMELAPGIAAGKTNAEFPVLDIVTERSDIYGWLQAPRNGYSDTEYDFEYYVINDSDEEKKVKITADSELEEITIPANSGIRRKFTKSFLKTGTITIPITVEYDEKTLDISENFNIQRALPSVEDTRKVADKIRKYAVSVKKLLDKCDAKGISTDYETIGYRVLERFPQYLEDDIANNDLTRVYYTEETCTHIYNEVTERLNHYLSGKEVPLEVPRYISGGREIDGVSIIADNMMPDGSIEKRPTFFVGYGHGDWSPRDTEKFSEWGANTQEMEIPLQNTMSYIKGWPLSFLNSPIAGIMSDTSVKKSGERSLKIEYESQPQGNRAAMLDHTIDVEPNTSYTLRGYIKGDDVTRVDISPNSWGARMTLPTGTYDWTEWSQHYTTTAEQTSLTIKVIIDGPCTFWMDDFEFINDETGENLIYNGGFEEATDDEIPIFDEHSANFLEIVSRLEANEAADSAVNLLLGPHYMSREFIAKYNMAHNGAGYMPYNPNAPEARTIVERFLRGVIPQIKEYKCIQSVELSNEPELWFDMCGDYYRDDWTKFLEERWGTIEALNISYEKNYTSFSEVTMERDETNPAHYYDYVTFNNIVFSDWARWMTGIIKEIWPEAKVGWKVMGQPRDAYNHRLTNGTTYDSYADFFDMNVCDYWDYFDDSVEPLVGGMWYDYMRSVKEMPVANTEDHVIPDGNENYDLKQADYVARNVWQGAIHGRAMTNIWIWGRNYDKHGVVYGGILFRPDAIYKTGKAALDLNRLSYQITALQKEEVDVGILYSDASMLSNQKAMQAAYRAYEAAMFNGKNARFVIESQKYKMHNYDLMIVPLQEYVSHETLDELVKYIENGGKVLVMGDESLTKNERNLANDASKVQFVMNNSVVIDYEGRNDQMTTPTEEELILKVHELLKEEGLCYIEVTEVITGNPTTDVEYNLGVYDGKVIINLANYGTDKTVKVTINGVPVTKAKELRSDKELGEEIELIQYVPITLEVETDNPFFDTYCHWSEEEVSELYGKGLVKGISPSRFNPQANITRAEFLALVNRASGFADAEYNGEIADVADDRWYANTVQAALDAGIITTDNFRPDAAITREEMCEILISAYEKSNGTLTEYDEADFNDNDNISNLAVVSKAASLGIVKGMDDGSFAPNGNATRAEASAVINRFDNLKIGE